MSPIPCPSCGKDLPSDPSGCPHCSLRLTGTDAARLWQVDQQLAALQAERSRLLAALRSTPTATGPTAPIAPIAPGAAAAAPSARRSWTTQQTLLAVGVLLVFVASSLALAIAWFVIGPYGQVLVMGGLTALAAYLSLHLSRRGLPSSAEALALVSGGLMLLDATAARRMGLFGLEHTDGRWYAVASGLLVAVLLGRLHQRDHRVAAFALLSLTAASVGWGGLVALAGSLADSAAAAAAMLGAAVFGALHQRLPSSTGLVRRAASGPAAGWTVAALLLGAAGALHAGATHVTPDGLLCVTALLLLAAGCGWAVRHVVTARTARLGSRAAVKADWLQRRLMGDWRALAVVAAVASLAPPVAVAGLGLQVGAAGTALLAILLGVGTIGVLSARPWGSGWTGTWAEAECGLGGLVLVGVSVGHGSRPALVATLATTALVALTAAVQRPAWRGAASTLSALAFVASSVVAASMVSTTAVCLTMAVTAALVSAAALLRPGGPEELGVGAVATASTVGALLLAAAVPLATWVLLACLVVATMEAAAAAALRAPARAVASGVAAVTGSIGLWVVGDLATPALQLGLVAAGGAVLVALGGWRRARPEELSLASAGLLVAVVAIGVGLERDWTHAASGLAAAYGLVASWYAALPERRAVVTTAVAALTAAVWVELAAAEVEVLEAYTVPLGVLLLAAGLWSHRALHDHSWLTLGPGLVVALLPSALLTVVADPLPRVAYVVVVGAGALSLGAWQRRQALVVVGAAAATIVGLTQLGPVLLLLDKSVVLGVVGVALLALGARYEQRRANARAAVSWLASMS